MAINTRKTTAPITKLPPTTKFPNDSITSPAALVPVLPSNKIKRDDEMFNASRNRVISSSVVGNTLNSDGFVMYIADSNITTETVMFAEISTSSSAAGKGVIIASTIPSTAIGTLASLQLNDRTATCHDRCMGMALDVFTRSSFSTLPSIQCSVDVS